MFQKEIFEQAEKNILAGLGFLDIAEAVSNSRSQSVLNPKPFIKECQSGQSDFAKVVMRDLLALIKEKNPSNIKFQAKKWVVNYDPMTEFMSDNFLNLIRSLSDRGLVSNRTADFVCSLGNIDYTIEKRNRIKEMVDGDDYTMFAKIIQNQEGKGFDIREEKTSTPEQKTQDNIPLDKKKGTPEAQNFNQSELEIDDEPIEDSLVFSEKEDLNLSRWKKNRVTNKFIRRGQENPSKFIEGSFKTIVLSDKMKIKAIVGKLKGSASLTIQSYLFDKKNWDEKKADEWLNKHLSSLIEKSELVISPYEGIAELPSGVRKRLDVGNQRKWLAVFNAAYKYYSDKFPNDKKKIEALSFKTAWSKVQKKSFLSSIKEIFRKK
jgi:cation transport regulator ChaB